MVAARLRVASHRGSVQVQLPSSWTTIVPSHPAVTAG